LSGDNTFSDVTLKGANLKGANLSEAYLKGINLDEINLSRANLSGAIVSGAVFGRARLADVLVEKTRFINCPDVSKAVRHDLVRRGATFDDVIRKLAFLGSPNPRVPR
jgi:uncharacterized protein YjbI with pentapeptide repeats